MADGPEVAAWRDQYDRMVADNIRRHGVHLQFVLGGPDRCPPSFAYTVGLFGIGHPELVAVGLCHHSSGAMLTVLARQIREGRVLLPGEVVASPDGTGRAFIEICPNPGEILFCANDHYQRPDDFSVPALQVTWTDDDGMFPWEPGYALAADVQPRPGMWRA